MKIKLIVSRAGVDFVQNAGDEIEVDALEGIRMIEAGQAIPVSEVVTEKAVKEPVVETRKRGK
jgi:hypothetical protein